MHCPSTSVVHVLTHGDMYSGCTQSSHRHRAQDCVFISMYLKVFSSENDESPLIHCVILIDTGQEDVTGEHLGSLLVLCPCYK